MAKFHPFLKEGHTKEDAERLEAAFRSLDETADLVELITATFIQRMKAGEFKKK